MDRMLCILVIFSLFLCSSGYYQQPEAVQFTTAPSDTVVCQGCNFSLTCSILRQPTSAGEKYVPLPELEWIFENGTRVSEASHGVQIHARDSLTHRSSDLTITNATSHHSGVYHCRALDGNDTSNCSGAESVPSVPCVPVTTISRPARIQIVAESSEEDSEVVDSCSDVVLLSCGSRLLEGESVERPTLTWKRDGQELTDQESGSSSSEQLLTNGNLVIDRRSNDSLGVYECVASFGTGLGQNVTVVRYNVTSPDSEATEDVLRVTSSRSRVLEGEGVKLVCEASLRDQHGGCLSYNVTWTANSSGRGFVGGDENEGTVTSETSEMSGHVLRISGVYNTSVYCCLVSTDDTVMEECTTIHVIRENAQPVDVETVFLREEEAVEISCLPSSPGPHHLTWYHNARLMENFTSSSLTVNRNESSDDQVFGVYQCFSSVGLGHVEEATLVRVLPYGRTNPASETSLMEVPYPPPNRGDINQKAAYRVSWEAPLFTGGLSTPLSYKITVRTPSIRDSFVSTTDSLLVYARVNVFLLIFVSVFDDIEISEPSKTHYPILRSECIRHVYYPPSPSVDCGHGQVNLSYVLDQSNAGIEGTEEVYRIGNCTHPNGSVHRFVTEEDFTNPHIFSEAVFAVGSHCRFSMASAMRHPDPPCTTNCFCFDERNVLHSHLTECTVQGFVEFESANLQVLENETSIDVCVRVRGYGFSFNISTVEQSAVAEYNFSPLINHQLYVAPSNGSVDQTLCIAIPITDNNVLEDEREKNFTVVLDVQDELVAVGNNHTLVEIIDNDYMEAALYFSHLWYTVAESAELLQVCVGLTVRPESDIIVMVTSDDITARGGSDYAAVNTTLVFSLDGETMQCFDVTVFSDSVYEGSEEFSLSMSSVDNLLATLDNHTVTVTILDDDVQFTQSSYTIMEGSEPLEVCVELLEDTEIQFSVIVLSNDSTAEADKDYVSVDERFSFSPNGSSTNCFNVTVLDDSITENAETFTLTLVAEDQHNSPIDSASITILDKKAATLPTAFVVGVSVGVAFFLIIVAMAGGVSCLMMSLYRRKLRRSEKKGAQEFDMNDQFDINFAPPILIGKSSYAKSDSKDDFDSRTLLDYLLAQELSATQVSESESSAKLTSTSADSSKEISPKGEYGVHPSVGYNVSVESGVVMDSSDPMLGRKISDWSYNYSQSSHSYIGVSGSVSCSCSDCKAQRGRSHSGQASAIES